MHKGFGPGRRVSISIGIGSFEVLGQHGQRPSLLLMIINTTLLSQGASASEHCDLAQTLIVIAQVLMMSNR